ncbi:L,D-transpeptidase family protein [Novosphingobium sp. 9]|uniref:L,D-transpeptidase family protein n=1 Tax=Novosphingobium sp. 9 TaxID=2025349 RepID=UPI0021B60951|nr:L,D-transpeptidase family protein [Novosphingobium sp. 9]
MNRNALLLLGSGVVALGAIGGALYAAGRPEAASPALGTDAKTVVAANVTKAAANVSAPAPSPAPARDAGFVIKRILPISGPIRYGDWHWDDAGVPQGPIVITVDLDARVISVFRDGYEIGTSAVLLGSDDKPTPLGVFPITQKDEHHVSNIYTGAPMPYMQRLTNDGITLHGSNVALGYVSHGCVGMPDDFAAKLFKTTHLGDKVYITRGKYVGMGSDLTGG